MTDRQDNPVAGVVGYTGAWRGASSSRVLTSISNILQTMLATDVPPRPLNTEMGVWGIRKPDSAAWFRLVTLAGHMLLLTCVVLDRDWCLSEASGLDLSSSSFVICLCRTLFSLTFIRIIHPNLSQFSLIRFIQLIRINHQYDSY